MKPSKQLNREPVSVPQGRWRKKYPCRRAKGEHVFKLVIPSFALSFNKGKTAQQYYAEQDTKHPPRFRVYECTVCGHIEYSFGKHRKRKIKIVKND